MIAQKRLTGCVSPLKLPDQVIIPDRHKSCQNSNDYSVSTHLPLYHGHLQFPTKYRRLLPYTSLHFGWTGSFVNLIGRLDEDTWIDQNTNETKSMMVIILDEIEYAAGGGNKPKENQTDPEQSQQQNAADPSSAQSQSGSQQLPENFTGFEPFGGTSFFDEN